MKQADLEINGYKVTIKEITPKIAVKILANTKEIFDGEPLDVQKFVSEKYDLAVELTKDFIIMPDGKDVGDLGFSDIDLIVEEFKVVNESFLVRWVGTIMSMGMPTPTNPVVPGVIPKELQPTKV